MGKSAQGCILHDDQREDYKYNSVGEVSMAKESKTSKPLIELHLTIFRDTLFRAQMRRNCRRFVSKSLSSCQTVNKTE